MSANDIRIAKLQVVREKLQNGKHVQNRLLKSLLSADAYARFLDDCQKQVELRETLADLPKPIIEYAKRLKAATFTYNKADAASSKGNHGTARKLFGDADTQFERLNEYLSENITGHGELEMFLDRHVDVSIEGRASSSPANFPCVVTSKSLRNGGGGILNIKRSKRQVKIDIIEAELTVKEVDDEKIAKALANGQRLLKHVND